MESSSFDLFISHATEDKAGFVEPLVAALGDGLSVWYDRSIFKLGDSIRDKIDEGLAGTRFGVVVLSRHYAQKTWTQRELSALMVKENTGEKVILPIWHGLSATEVAELFPTLADRFAVSSAEGIPRCVQAILHALSDEASLSPAHRRNTKVIGLSREEREVLLAAVDGDGNVLSVGYKQGYSVQAGRRNFTETADQRTIEKYKAAVRVLVDRGYLEPQGYKNEVFKVSHEGYDAADQIMGDRAAALSAVSVDWGETFARYRKDFPEATSFLSISNLFARPASASYDDFRRTVLDSRLRYSLTSDWPCFCDPPEGKTLEWRRRRGLLVSYSPAGFWDIREIGAFLFCTDSLCCGNRNRGAVGIRRLLHWLILDLTYGAQLADSFGIGGSGGGVTLAVHGVLDMPVALEDLPDPESSYQTVFPTCIDNEPRVEVSFDFPKNADAIRNAAVGLLEELLTFFPQGLAGDRVTTSHTLQGAARIIQDKNQLQRYYTDGLSG